MATVDSYAHDFRAALVNHCATDPKEPAEKRWSGTQKNIFHAHRTWTGRAVRPMLGLVDEWTPLKSLYLSVPGVRSGSAIARIPATSCSARNFARWTEVC